MKKTRVAVLASLFMGFVGLFAGSLLNDFFGGASFDFSPLLSIVFVIITMGAFILSSVENNK